MHGKTRLCDYLLIRQRFFVSEYSGASVYFLLGYWKVEKKTISEAGD